MPSVRRLNITWVRQSKVNPFLKARIQREKQEAEDREAEERRAAKAREEAAALEAKQQAQRAAKAREEAAALEAKQQAQAVKSPTSPSGYENQVCMHSFILTKAFLFAWHCFHTVEFAAVRMLTVVMVCQDIEGLDSSVSSVSVEEFDL
jgi:hypothetical protein